MQDHRVSEITALRWQQGDAVDSRVDYEAQRSEHEYDYVRFVKGVAKAVLDDYGKGKTQQQEEQGQGATDSERLRNNVDTDDPGYRYEDEAVKHLPRYVVFSAKRVDNRAKQQGKDTEC
jgi:hypothetical protein